MTIFIWLFCCLLELSVIAVIATISWLFFGNFFLQFAAAFVVYLVLDWMWNNWRIAKAIKEEL